MKIKNIKHNKRERREGKKNVDFFAQPGFVSRVWIAPVHEVI